MVNLSGILERRHTTVIGSVVDEIMAGQGIKKAFELMPIKNTFSQYRHPILTSKVDIRSLETFLNFDTQ